MSSAAMRRPELSAGGDRRAKSRALAEQLAQPAQQPLVLFRRADRDPQLVEQARLGEVAHEHAALLEALLQRRRGRAARDAGEHEVALARRGAEPEPGERLRHARALCAHLAPGLARLRAVLECDRCEALGDRVHVVAVARLPQHRRDQPGRAQPVAIAQTRQAVALAQRAQQQQVVVLGDQLDHVVAELRVDEIYVRFVDEQHAFELARQPIEVGGGGELAGGRVRVDDQQ
jgi:hypothetical protein